jgi:hypothetical protein
MMRTLLVGYDLNKPGQAYPQLWNKLESYPGYWHHLDSTWLIRAELTAVELRDELKQFLDISDELLVIDVTSKAAAWLGFNQRGSDWIHKNL